MTRKVQCAVVFAGAVICVSFPLKAQVSPGPLSKAHHSFDSPLKCASCHAFGAGEEKLRCLNCHREIAQLLKDREGMHGRVVDRGKGDTDCARCHTEHYGENFRIFKWDTSEEEFDHRKTGYPLAGKHAALQCRQCHEAKHIASADRKLIQDHDLKHTFEGLHPACLTCHEDRHAGQLGAECQTCHDVSGWKPVKNFDHSTTHFPLTGKHMSVDCAKCHKPAQADAKAIRYRGLSFSTCNGCHQDPHHGAFAARCESCHNTGSWNRVELSHSSFDHSQAKFSLSGKHANVACEKCHANSDFKAPVAHEKCMDCHQDPHKGQFKHRADGGECSSCHTDAGWKPALFTQTSHQATAYPLAGKHQALECARCHAPAGLDTNYHPAFQACSECHKDAHASQFAGPPHNNRCEDCHSVEGFRPSLFTLSRHQSTAFALKAAHMAVACEDCHRKQNAPVGADRQYHFGNRSCTGCHQDPHNGEFPEVVKASAKAGRDLCESCHGLRSWHDLKTFDHSNTSFALDGAHRVAVCVDCHRTSEAAGSALRQIPFKSAPEQCAGCHEDVHGGQFLRGTEVVNCGACHDKARWNSAKFDHNSASSFSLAGAHEKVPCRMCHTEEREINSRDVVIYRGTPRECVACHR